MRARLTLCSLAAAAFVTTGCQAIRPKESVPDARQSAENECLNGKRDSIHLVLKDDVPQAPPVDPELESLLGQTSAPRLAGINRSIYLMLRSLDEELRREQKLAACRNPFAVGAPAQAASQSQDAAGVGAANAGASANADGTAGGGAATNAAVVVSVGSSASAGTAGGTGAPANSGSGANGDGKGKTGKSATGGGGNGAVGPKTAPGSDNDVVAKRLRRAAEQEPDPVLRAKLWQEYWAYRQGTAAK